MTVSYNLGAPSPSLRHKAGDQILVLVGFRLQDLGGVVNLGQDHLHVEVPDVGQNVVLHAGKVRLH